MPPDVDEQEPQAVHPERVTGRGFPAAELRRALLLVFVAWIFGAAFMSIISGAALTSFLTKYLRTDDFTYGLIMAAGLFFFLGSYVNERSGRIKRNFLIFVTLLLPMRLPGTGGMQRVARAVATEMPLSLPGVSGRRRRKG